MAAGRARRRPLLVLVGGLGMNARDSEEPVATGPENDAVKSGAVTTDADMPDVVEVESPDLPTPPTAADDPMVAIKDPPTLVAVFAKEEPKVQIDRLLKKAA